MGRRRDGRIVGRFQGWVLLVGGCLFVCLYNTVTMLVHANNNNTSSHQRKKAHVHTLLKAKCLCLFFSTTHLTTLLILYSTTTGFPFSTMNRPAPTYLLFSRGLRSSSPVCVQTKVPLSLRLRLGFVWYGLAYLECEMADFGRV
jgi:hypothetical protein